ncbi:hypothetical protein [Sorangium cellulosum]|uniref:hypothetical protein n=1 Tax=Sorangium cellulosum TaxID=56 RepID=UPI000407F5B2|nr:hypothetical protein [Sorangium cellulosum]
MRTLLGLRRHAAGRDHATSLCRVHVGSIGGSASVVVYVEDVDALAAQAAAAGATIERPPRAQSAQREKE